MSRQIAAAYLLFLLYSPAIGSGAEFRSEWRASVERPWAGPEYWSNPLQDWRVAKGRLECVGSGGDRNVFLLTREAGRRRGGLATSVRVGCLEPEEAELSQGWVGFKLGLRGFFNDYRDTAVRGRGLHAGMTTAGLLFIGKPEPTAPKLPPPFRNLELRLRAEPHRRRYTIHLTVLDPSGAALAELTRGDVPPEWLVGGLALACSSGAVPETPVPEAEAADYGWQTRPDQRRGGNVRFWFSDWRVSGPNIVAHDERAFGPILFAQYTLSRGVLKLTAQLAPVEEDVREVHLQIPSDTPKTWTTIATAPIDPLSRTTSFRIPAWDDSSDTPYRLSCIMAASDGRPTESTFEGTVARDPSRQREIVVAAFTGNNDFGFPHNDIAQHVSWFDPDLLVFTGDQVYEPVGGYGIQREPLETAVLDYLRKWYIYGWAFRDLLRDRPTVCLVDDHDVYHGNLWGAGGRRTSPCGAEGQDLGGYCMGPEWVKMVHRTQTSHLPDPFDPTPVEQDIPVYYTDLLCGGVSFGIIEDRKWKSAPKAMLPEAEIRNGWALNPDYDAGGKAEVTGGELLGDRQLRFLEQWAADWEDGVWMKVVLSQTLFADLMTLPREMKSDNGIKNLPILKRGEYPAGEKLVRDRDSNGWPPGARGEALRITRKGFAIHICGDQHLGSTVQYGVDDWNDAAFAICVPSVSNIFPRRWFPPMPGNHPREGLPPYTGEYHDGFGNRMTVWAVSNPAANGIEPTALHHRAPGYGIVTLDRTRRTITFANWPRWVDPSRPGAEPYPGWPVTVAQTDNYTGRARVFFPTLRIHGLRDPVVQVVSEPDEEIISTLRIRGNEHTPKVFVPGAYTVKVGEPGTDRMRTIHGLIAREGGDAGYLVVDLR